MGLPHSKRGYVMLSKAYKKQRRQALLILLPSVMITVIFVIYPTIRTLILSFQRWNGVANATREWVGLSNYLSVLTSKKFWNAMLNSLYFTIGGFVILMPVAFLLAMLVTSQMKFTGFFKTMYLLPVMLGTTAVGLMWTFILNSKFGVLAQFLTSVGLSKYIIDWLSTPTVNIWCVVLVNEWMYAGYNMLIFAAGLVAIPADIHDACKIDGCKGIKKLIHVTIPLCKNMFMVFSVLCITGCLKAVDIVWAMTRGGPMGHSSTLAILLYTEGFQFKLMGRSSAIGIILLTLGLVLSVTLNHTIFKTDDNL